MRLGGNPKSKQNRSGAETSGHRTSFDRGNMHRERAGLLHNRGAPALFHVKNCESSCGSYPGTNERQHDLEIKMESALRKASLLSTNTPSKCSIRTALSVRTRGAFDETHVRTQSVSRETIILFFCFTSGDCFASNCNCRRVDIHHSNAAIVAPGKTLQAFSFCLVRSRPATHSPALAASISIIAIFCMSS